ncbi:MAG TPA: hypothetical protein VGM06_24125 [Polyangiaceae bacterium]
MAALLAAATLDCQNCPKELRGISDGDTIETTIVSNDTAAVASVLAAGGATPSCGGLGDLPAGAVLTSTASVVNDQGAESCFDVLSLTPRTVSTGTLSPASTGAVLQLPSGCSGQFDVYFQSPDDTSSFLDDDPSDGGQPAWWLMRRFEVEGDPSLCFSTGDAPATCIDAFLAKNVRR